ncbi:SpaA isopeptide-forming pilin-related protein [Faecalibaculum rodentium]|uniref:SpaA isopeptide-forming pilin-related protein n=1 Tax=Faecalibaculum rodentium TaxID=1702221 RepID=UPI0025A501E5|nr:SpaA isopeptide-forming pilin-related protein [Faecalibaculum rodentium]
MNGGAITDHVGDYNSNGSASGIKEPGAGILIQGTTTVTLDGGVEICRNITQTGTGNAFVGTRNNGGGGINVKSGATLNVNSAKICANAVYSAQGNPSGSWATGGGIKAESGASVYLREGALIHGNMTDNSGGGISLSDTNTTLYMLDGEISNNIARLNEGGGLSLQAKDSSGNFDGYATAILFEGKIAGNITKTNNQWGGGGIFVGHTANLILPRGATVQNNWAYVYGGGIAGCSTGKIAVDEKVVVNKNELGNGERWSAGEKPYAGTYSTAISLNKDQAHDYFTCFFASVYGMFGDQGASWTGNVDGGVVTNVESGWLTSKTCMGLTAGNLKEGPSKLIIEGNRSDMHGGGILINGYMIGGNVKEIFNSEPISIKSTKAITDKDGAIQESDKSGFIFQLWSSDETTLISTGTSDAQGNIIFHGIAIQPDPKPDIDSNSSGIASYVLKEINGNRTDVSYDTKTYEIRIPYSTSCSKPIEKEYVDPITQDKVKIIVLEYNTTIQHNSNGNKITVSQYPDDIEVTPSITHDSIVVDPINGTTHITGWTIDLSNVRSPATFVNIKTPVRKIRVEKNWVGDSTDYTDKNIKITLYRKLDGEDDSSREKVSEVQLNKDSNWQYEWGAMPTSDISGKNYIYSVEEESIPGYVASYQTVIDGPQTEQKQVWVKANSIEAGKQYLLVDESTDQSLKNTTHEHDIDSNDTVKLTNKVSSVDGQKSGYLQQNNLAVLTAKNISGRTGLMMTRSNGHYLVGSYESDNGIQFSSKYGNSNDLNGFLYDGNKATLYSWDGEGPKGDFVTFNSNPDVNSFGISRKHNNNPHYPVFYHLENIEINVDNSTKPIKFTITNTKIVYQLRVEKVDSANSNKKLQGAVFNLYSGTDLQTNPLRTGITDKNGSLIFSDLQPGVYTLVETKAPEGYLLRLQNSKPITINLDTTKVDANVQTIRFSSVKIENELQKYELPETGSAGTKVYTATGTILLLTGTCLYRYKRRRRRKGGEAH